MRYRHGFHAGNFADVHKHVALLALLHAMQRKDRGFLYVDTHAGAGGYPLSGTQTRRDTEARRGFEALQAASTSLRAADAPLSPQIDDYLRAVARARERHGRHDWYPGSPYLAAQALRTQDRALCCERLAPEYRLLAHALGALPRVRLECADGYRCLAAALPPRERRALVLIDPPYEAAAESDAALEGAGRALARLARAVIAIWYPIKHERDLDAWMAHAALALHTPTLRLELWLHRPDSRIGLNGSGMLLVNPPYGFDAAAARWLPQLRQALDPAGHGGSRLLWLVSERDAHACA